MTKQAPAAGEPPGFVAKHLTPTAGREFPPSSVDAGFGSKHLTAIAEPAGGFQEEPAPAFATMPESMPPPPLRPVLPPDLPESERPSLIARLLGSKSKQTVL